MNTGKTLFAQLMDFLPWTTSENAVKSQIRIALSVYVLVAIVKKRLISLQERDSIHSESQAKFVEDFAGVSAVFRCGQAHCAGRS